MKISGNTPTGRKAFLLVALALIFSFSGCATSSHEGSHRIRTGDGCYENLDSQLRLLDLKALFKELANDLCLEKPKEIDATGPINKVAESQQNTTVLVTDFVDLSSLNPKPAGILMGELMRSSLNSVCGYKIQQAELSKYFSLTEKGLVVLTRDISSIRQDNVANNDFVVGTFSQSSEKLVLFVKRFDLTSGIISRISSKEVDFSCSSDYITFKIK